MSNETSNRTSPDGAEIGLKLALIASLVCWGLLHVLSLRFERWSQLPGWAALTLTVVGGAAAWLATRGGRRYGRRQLLTATVLYLGAWVVAGFVARTLRAT